jgi:hypothetical protein
VSDSLETIRRECAESQARAIEARQAAIHKVWVRTIVKLAISLVLFVIMSAVLAIYFM